MESKILELIQAWAHAFRKDPSFRIIQDTFNVMKAEGHQFPSFKETEAMRHILTKLLSERLTELVGCFTTVTIQKIRIRRIN